MNIGIVGMGLIGGSLARTLKINTKHTVFACDRDPSALEKAADINAMDGVLDDSNIGDCQVILVALYPQNVVDWLEANGAKIMPGTLVVDCAGVKRPVCDGVRPIARRYGWRFLGGHPMAGKEKSGFDNTSAELFLGASMILTPEYDTDESAIRDASELFMSMGFGGIRISTPDEHDHMIAYTSQLAHVLSSAYVKSPSALRHQGFSAGSFRDMTRVATMNVNMWTELFLENSGPLALEVEALAARLMEYAIAIRTRNEDALRALLEEGTRIKAEVDKGGKR